MTRLWSLVFVLVLIALGSVGLMYVADWLATARIDHRGVAVSSIASEVAARTVIEDRGVSVSEILEMITSSRYLNTVPVLVMTTGDVDQYRDAINVRGLGIECVVILTDEIDPYRGIRRVWVSDASVVQSFRSNGQSKSSTLLFPGRSVPSGACFRNELHQPLQFKHASVVICCARDAGGIRR